MRVCAKCFAERGDKVKVCPNCGMVEEYVVATQRPRLPFGFKVNGEAPVGVEMFRGFALTTLQAGDVIEWSLYSHKVTIRRGQDAIWFWKRGRWQASLSNRDWRTYWIARDIVAIVAAMGGLRAVPRKERRQKHYTYSWVLKK